MDIQLTPIGHVRGGRPDVRDDDWGAERCAIELDAARFTPDALLGLDAFSHVDVLFQFHLVPESKIETGARHPRGNTDWPRIGIFAQRGKNRPNRIGLTTCEVVAVDGLRLLVRGLDAVDGTPVLDLKPHMRGFLARSDVREPAWAAELMRDYW